MTVAIASTSARIIGLLWIAKQGQLIEKRAEMADPASLKVFAPGQEVAIE